LARARIHTHHHKRAAIVSSCDPFPCYTLLSAIPYAFAHSKEAGDLTTLARFSEATIIAHPRPANYSPALTLVFTLITHPLVYRERKILDNVSWLSVCTVLRLPIVPQIHTLQLLDTFLFFFPFFSCSLLPIMLFPSFPSAHVQVSPSFQCPPLLLPLRSWLRAIISRIVISYL